MRKISGTVDGPIETTGRPVRTWRDALAYTIPGLVFAGVLAAGYVLNRLGAMSWPLVIGYLIVSTFYVFIYAPWAERIAVDLYRRYPPRSGTRYVPSRSCTASTIAGPQCPAGIAAPSAIQ